MALRNDTALLFVLLLLSALALSAGTLMLSVAVRKWVALGGRQQHCAPRSIIATHIR